MKTCTKCHLVKELIEFNIRTDSGNHRNNCKECQYSNQKKWRINNPDHLKKNRKYYSNNRDILLDQKKEYYIKNIVKIEEYRELNKDRSKKTAKLYNSMPRQRIKDRIRQKERKALKKSTSDKTINVESLNILINKQNNKCYHCNCELDSTKHLDHYIPLSKGGTHSINNVVWSCATCNLRKSAKIPTTLF